MQKTSATSGSFRRTQKSRSGCVTCKERKLKCDEAEPACRRCIKSGLTCPGYTRPVKWSTKYERNYGSLSSPSIISGHTSASDLPQPDHLDYFNESQHVSGLGRGSGDAIWSEDFMHTQNSSSSNQPGRHDSSSQYEDATDSPEITFQDNSADELTGLCSLSFSQNTAHVINTSASFELVCNTARSTTLGDSLTLYSPQDEYSMLLSHYFSSVCQVASSFDSAYNPYRSDLSGMIRFSPIIFNCVMSMSAAHLCQQNGVASLTPLKFQTEAISQISDEVAKMELAQYFSISQQDDYTDANKSLSRPTVKEDLLIGIIVLGMTSSWHDPSSLGLCHFRGARQLFKLWMVENDVIETAYSLSRAQSFLVSSMVYWEVMVSCLVDQETNATSHLDVFCNLQPTFFSYPCPWTGVGTSILIRLAKCITLVRQNRRSYYLAKDPVTLSVSRSQLVEEALALAEDVGQSQIPFTLQETGDIRTPADHFYKIAQCHRLVALLELHRAFPEITYGQRTISRSRPTDDDRISQYSQRVLGLAVDILEIMRTIPEDSRTIAIQSLIFLSAGSALVVIPTVENGGEVSPASMSRALITSWRQFVLGRLYKSYLSIKLETINRVASVLREVWSRMDSLTAVAPEALPCDEGPLMHAHWIDVMIEGKLETILG